ncbi:WXG100 family type VII secretion target [Streptomyces subrutilus]|uniref:WXG100 family type VII secretion target n=1 Tax=Streptomyces subrutilus TaxID=36818 RepID=UPI0033CB7071
MATNFEGYSHAQLAAMVASLDPKTVSQRGTQLTEAAKTIKEIGQKLKDHKVKGWEGEAATAFQEWVNRAGSATLVLADFSSTGGHWMTLAAQTMSEIHMPKYDAGAEADLKENLEISRKYHNDPDAKQLGREAWSKLSGDHARAVDALTKLSQSYALSKTEMDRATIPTFPTPPPVFVPQQVDGEGVMARPGGSSGQGNSSGSSSYASAAPSGSSSANEPGWVPGLPPQQDAPPVPVVVAPDRDVAVDLDAVTTLPNPTAPPVTLPPAGPLPTGPTGPAPVAIVPQVPLPPVGGMRTIPGIGPVGPVGPVPGTSGPLGKIGLPPRGDTGIVGGRPVTPAGPGSGIPRGTVIGTEAGHAGRPVNGMMGGGLGGAHAGTGGPVGGRRLATEPGGIVGGRQPAAGSRATPFTPGGSGLVRSNVGGVGAGMQTPGNRRDDQRGERPDYLAEDEETWQGNRRVVPPVID